MSRFISAWGLPIGLAVGLVCGMVTVAKNRRTSKMRRQLRRACKTMSELSSAVMHMFP